MSVTAAEGFVASGLHAGIKRRKFDMALLATDGPDNSQASVLELIRTSLQKAAKGQADGSVAIPAALQPYLKTDRITA